MPWKEVTEVEQRKNLIDLVLLSQAPIAEICRQLGISRKTAYKWINRYQERDLSSLANRSRRPHHFPHQVDQRIEDRILQHREAHPTWGARKIARLLLNENLLEVPALSTITEVLRRQGKLQVIKSTAAFQRFERALPNDLWQMDFKGHFPLTHHRCHPLTVLDDHSRFSLCLKACEDETGETVKSRLVTCFRTYGLPRQINCDNGSPWGNSSSGEPWNRIAIWLMKLGIQLTHSRPYHPQTNGKLERFHRSLKQELLNQTSFDHLEEAQHAFDQWQHLYNYYRPHEALDMQTPSTRYQPSQQPYPEKLPPIDYEEGFIRKVDADGKISFKGISLKVGHGFRGEYVALKETDQDGLYSIFFMHNNLGTVDLNDMHPE
jgi:transposase InsO family protein